jgi:microcompartment protein CcmK/EutM
MRIAIVQGTVTLSRGHMSLLGGRLKLATPLTIAELQTESTTPGGETLVVWDDLGAGEGSLIAVSEGGEAAQPFRPQDKPIDAYCAAILDAIDI